MPATRARAVSWSEGARRKSATSASIITRLMVSSQRLDFETDRTRTEGSELVCVLAHSRHHQPLPVDPFDNREDVKGQKTKPDDGRENQADTTQKRPQHDREHLKRNPEEQ